MYFRFSPHKIVTAKNYSTMYFIKFGIRHYALNSTFDFDIIPMKDAKYILVRGKFRTVKRVNTVHGPN